MSRYQPVSHDFLFCDPECTEHYLKPVPDGDPCYLCIYSDEVDGCQYPQRINREKKPCDDR